MRTLLISESQHAAARFTEELAAYDVDVKVVDSLDEATVELAGFWPDAVVVDLPWSQSLASWVHRNLTRYWVKTFVTRPMTTDPVREAIVMPDPGDVDFVAKALASCVHAATKVA